MGGESGGGSRDNSVEDNIAMDSENVVKSEQVKVYSNDPHLGKESDEYQIYVRGPGMYQPCLKRLTERNPTLGILTSRSRHSVLQLSRV